MLRQSYWWRCVRRDRFNNRFSRYMWRRRWWGGVAEGLVDLTGINSVSITVGAGGAPVSGISVNGKNGGSSSFGTYMSASGGYSGGQPSGGLGAVGVGEQLIHRLGQVLQVPLLLPHRGW